MSIVDERKLRCALVLLLFVVLIAYLPSLRNGFVNLDDHLHVTKNQYVQKGITLDGAVWAFSNTHAGYWIPITFISHMLDVEVFGLNPAGHHAVNLILHCVNTLLLFSCLLALTTKCHADPAPGAISIPWRCFVVAALFGLHPIHVESVAWITERKDVLSTMFWLLAMYAYAWHARSPSMRRMLVVTLCMAFGLMAKPMLVTLPFALFLLDYWPLSRTPNAPCSGVPRATWSALIVEKIPLLVLTIVASFITSQTQMSYGASAPLSEWGFWQRVTTALSGYLGYLEKAFLPIGLAAHYPLRKAVPFLEWSIGGTLIVGLTYLVIKLRREAPYGLVGWLWLLGTLVPVIGLMQAGTQAMADRFSYVPFIGLYIMVVWGVAAALERLSYGRALGLMILIPLCITLSALTWHQTRYWHDSVSLFKRMVDVNPDNYRMRERLAAHLELAGDFVSAEEQHLRVLRDHPDYAPSLTGLGVIYAKREEYKKAIEVLEKSLTLEPNSWVTHNTFGASLEALGRYEEAREHFVQALRLDPDSSVIKKNLEIINRKFFTRRE